jgi:hypothetical protein
MLQLIVDAHPETSQNVQVFPVGLFGKGVLLEGSWGPSSAGKLRKSTIGRPPRQGGDESKTDPTRGGPKGRERPGRFRINLASARGRLQGAFFGACWRLKKRCPENLEILFVILPASGRTWPRDPLQRVGLINKNAERTRN